MQKGGLNLSPDLQEAISNRLGGDLRHGFFEIIGKDKASTQSLLLLNLHLSKCDTCILQSWIPNFNLTEPTNLLVPVSITLKFVSNKFRSSVADIARSIGSTIGFSKSNPYYIVLLLFQASYLFVRFMQLP